MDVKKAIETRKSIRKYLDKKVPEEIIESLIESARLAPSGNNVQPSRYLIISDNKVKEELRKNNVFVQNWVYSSPVLIFCFADPGVYNKQIKGRDDSNEMRALRDLSIASSYLVLRATELKLGTCYIGWRDEKKIKEIFSAPKNYILPYVISVGYPNENPPARSRKRIDEIIFKPTKME